MQKFSLAFVFLTSFAVSNAEALSPVSAASYQVLYSFTGGSDGAYPNSGVIRDSAGNLFGTTLDGGEHNNGTVFKLDPEGKETVLYKFQGKNDKDGGNPFGGLVPDAAGNYYGTTFKGGYQHRGVCQGGCGTVFKLSADGTETVLYRFKGGSDGNAPVFLGSLLLDASSNLFGTTFKGGHMADCHGSGCGVVFKVAPDGTETVLYAFTGGRDGSLPYSSLIGDAMGNLYGTAAQGGQMADCNGYGCGVVFKVASDGTESVLYAFTDGSDGATPLSGLIRDKAGNLYGTADVGGNITSCYGGCGVVFKIAPDGTETALYAFNGGTNDGWSPAYVGVVEDAKGNFYGTTHLGGSGCGGGGCGIAYKLSPDGTETVLYSFGGSPSSGLIKVGKYLYGTTSQNGTYGAGTVFRLTE